MSLALALSVRKAKLLLKLAVRAQISVALEAAALIIDFVPSRGAHASHFAHKSAARWFAFFFPYSSAVDALPPRSGIDEIINNCVILRSRIGGFLIRFLACFGEQTCFV